jgi:hypothetical protein
VEAFEEGLHLSWSRRLDLAANGTRFRLFPQAPYGTATASAPETVWLSPPAGAIGPGPQDDRMYVVDPVGKARPYGIARGLDGAPVLYSPPWDGPIFPPAMPSPEGYFDYLEVGTPEFEAAHAYGVARVALDVWEGYLGRPIVWHFIRDFERLEISLFRDSDNAFAGYGYMELGAQITETGSYRPFSLNFDVIAHEIGHLIIYSQVGVPALDAIEGEYFGFHESAADLAALVAALHFDSVIDQVLESSRGNLYTYNELNRFAELSENEQIRLASNSLKLSAFAAGWTDEHDLSQPLTGAIFDTFIDVFHESLLDLGLISPQVEDIADQLERRPEYAALMQALFDEAYSADSEGFRRALADARDFMGICLARTWSRLSPDYLNYDDVGDRLLDADRELTGGRLQRAIVKNFRWREIGQIAVGPRLEEPGAESHAFSARAITPESQPRARRPSYRERWQIARGGISRA